MLVLAPEGPQSNQESVAKTERPFWVGNNYNYVGNSDHVQFPDAGDKMLLPVRRTHSNYVIYKLTSRFQRRNDPSNGARELCQIWVDISKLHEAFN